METGKRCLIVVDYQKDFVDGSLGFEKAVTLDHGIAEKIRLYHSRGDDVMFTLDTHNDDYPTTQEGKNLPVPHCIAGTPGHRLFGETAACRQKQDMVFFKPSFGSMEMLCYLRTHPPCCARQRCRKRACPWMRRFARPMTRRCTKRHSM